MAQISMRAAPALSRSRTCSIDGLNALWPVWHDRCGPAGSASARPAGPVPTPAEAEALFRSLIGYSGTYTVEGDKVTHHVDISWNESWSGTDQVRTFKFEGDRVILSTEPSLDPFHGKMSVRRLTWQKLK
jgi:Lipocalin-like domain